MSLSREQAARWLQTVSSETRHAEIALETRVKDRKDAIRMARATGMKLETIAQATGLSKQRISQIVKDGER